jgi:sec-independent protein translocase protein TatA
MIENLFNFFPGGTELVIILVAAGVLLFGAKKIPELAKTFGKAKGEYKKGEIEADKELKEFKDSKE